MLYFKPRFFSFVILLACASSEGMAQQRQAKDYPTKQIRLVLPYAPGGGIDFVGHVLGQKIALSIGQNMFVDNRGGASGTIGTDVVAKAPPDGYTILVSSTGHASLPSFYKNLPYDAVKDFTPITIVARSVGFVLVVHPSVPAQSVKQLVALAKAQPGRLNFGSPGVGTVIHLATEAFNMLADTRMTHVPYKGTGPAIIDAIGGRLDVFISPATSALERVRSGKLRPLGITATVRWKELEDVPTIAEAGLTGYKYDVWYGLWYPAGVPSDYAHRMRLEVVKAFEDTEIRNRFIEQGFLPVASTPQEMSKAVLEEFEFHRRLAKRMAF